MQWVNKDCIDLPGLKINHCCSDNHIARRGDVAYIFDHFHKVR